jgi:hypothetical protein
MEPEKPVTDEEIWEAINDAHRLYERFQDRLKERLDKADTALLQSHFLIEEQLDALLTVLALQPYQLDLEVSFAVKVKILRAFAPLGEDPRWKIIEAINKVRNEIAHPKSGDKKEKALHKLRDSRKQVSGRHIDRMDSFDVLVSSTMISIVFLSEIERAIKAPPLLSRSKESSDQSA